MQPVPFLTLLHSAFACAFACSFGLFPFARRGTSGTAKKTPVPPLRHTCLCLCFSTCRTKRRSPPHLFRRPKRQRRAAFDACKTEEGQSSQPPPGAAIKSHIFFRQCPQKPHVDKEQASLVNTWPAAMPPAHGWRGEIGCWIQQPLQPSCGEPTPMPQKGCRSGVLCLCR